MRHGVVAIFGGQQENLKYGKRNIFHSENSATTDANHCEQQQGAVIFILIVVNGPTRSSTLWSAPLSVIFSSVGIDLK